MDCQREGDSVKRIVVLSDPQIPYHDKKSMGAVYRFLADYQPDEIASVGDDVDFPQNLPVEPGHGRRVSG